MSEQYRLFEIERFKGKVIFNVLMSEHTSFKIGGPADCMAFPEDEGDLRSLLAFAASKNFPVYAFGNGTNILVRDGGIRGVVMNMSHGFKDINWGGAASCVVDCGVRMTDLLSACKERCFSGFEFAAGIPGTVGGAVLMNAGAYGFEMKDVTEGVEVLTSKLKRRFFSKAELGFSYRKSEIPEDSIVLKVHMRFQEKTKEEIEARIKEFRKKRELGASIKYPNAGSVFKNPAGDFAGRLIEEAGLKGETLGGAQISNVHANYMVNLGGAKAKDVLGLMAIARDKVYKLKGVVLEPEIKVIGED